MEDINKQLELTDESIHKNTAKVSEENAKPREIHNDFHNYSKENETLYK